jgi:hypothetical protein
LQFFCLHSLRTPFPAASQKKAVAQYGEAALESWARSKGIADKEIEKARRCLK